jgi:hypothetical protein
MTDLPKVKSGSLAEPALESESPPSPESHGQVRALWVQELQSLLGNSRRTRVAGPGDSQMRVSTVVSPGGWGRTASTPVQLGAPPEQCGGKSYLPQEAQTLSTLMCLDTDLFPFVLKI